VQKSAVVRTLGGVKKIESVQRCEEDDRPVIART
jgi:hypothetical protein